MAKITGSCLCGKVRYSADVEPVFTGVCHCRNCQKQSGSAFATFVGVPQSAMAVQGQVKTYVDRADSGKAMYRRFCPDCGSTLMQEREDSGVAAIEVGTLDDASWVKPAMQIYCDSAQPWVQLGDDMVRFPKMPPPPR